MLGLRDLCWSDPERPAERRASGCPADAQEKRPSEVSQEVAAEDRGAERVAAREPVDERSKCPEDEPLVRLPEHFRPRRTAAGQHALHVRQRPVENGRHDARRSDDQPESTDLHSEKLPAGRVVGRGRQ